VVRHLAAGTAARFQASQSKLLVVVPVVGVAEVRGISGVERVAVGDALVIGQVLPVTLAAAVPSALVVLEICRSAVQVEAYARTALPRRTGRVSFVVDCSDPESPFAQAVASDSAFRIRSAERTAAAVDRDAVAALAGEFCARSDCEGVFPLAGSVRRALDELAQPRNEAVSLEDVMRAAGVIHLTLRRAVKEITGISLAQLLLDARLAWTRARLGSDRESRSLSELAAALGLKPTAFARAYQRRFGETPSQTRSRAFQSAR
jgi:AraC-like DNA-binding protein